MACSTAAVGVAGAGVAQAAPASSATYTVVQDDTLYGISKKLGVSLDALLATNGLTAKSMIHPGMVLQVPAGGTLPSTTSASTSGTGQTGTAGATTYTIVAGDSIYAIAQKFGLKYGAILKANKLELDSVLTPGRTLIIPAGGTLVVSPTTASPGPATSNGSTGSAGATSTYTIVAGDSIFAIAQKYGLKYGAILKANDMKLDSVLTPGRTLTIPAGGTLVVSPTPGASGPASTPTTPTAAMQGKIDTVVAYAKAQLGKPWEFAADGPDSFDCSGLTKMAYAQIGISLPHSSLLQGSKGVAVDFVNGEIQAGDLIFMASSNGTPGVIGHVGIAIDSKRWIHSPELGDVVRMGFIPSDAKIIAVRRFVTA
ncbi:MAG: LysM peptidoglycan-binding domain-containing protein [Acidimicrobiales bacterium]